MGPSQIVETLRSLGIRHEDIAKAIGRERTAATKMMNGQRSVQFSEVEPLLQLIRQHGGDPGNIATMPDLPVVDPSQAYVSVEVLPTFAGMGGRGTGDGDPEVALVSRRLVEDELRARPVDLLLVNVRGPSMEPLFLHGDQLLIDTRDKSPTQPGPFALLFSDGYAIKDVAWIERRTLLRISSRNDEYPEEVLPPDEVQIIGRPVWFARRL